MRTIKILLMMLCCFSVLMTSCAVKDKSEDQTQPAPAVQGSHDMRGVWLTCYELSGMLSSSKKKDFVSQVNKMLDKCDSYGLNTIFVHVRPFADSIYPSNVYPLSEYVLSSSGKAPDFDVLEVFISTVRERNYSVHAWINPYRISYKTDLDELAADALANNKNFNDAVIRSPEGFYLDPSSEITRRTVLAGVREILDNYDVDGIHIDDYFYPTTEKSFDAESYNAYCNQGGKLSLDDWRRGNVSALLNSLYSLVHLYEGKIFSISPSGDIDKNYRQYYADVEMWMKSDGFADVIIPQIYFGFEHDEMPFENVAEEWAMLRRTENVKLVCGLASYKQGKTDELAGAGAAEWKNDKNIILKQKDSILNKGYSGYVLFSYKDL